MTVLSSDASGNMVGEVAQFDLMGEIADFESSKPWVGGLHSKTLFKKQDFRMVLIAMEAGAKMKEHHTDGTVSVQALMGSVRVRAQEKSHELAAGNVLTIGASIPHDVEALEESAFLLTISWPSHEALLAMKHRGYGT